MKLKNFAPIVLFVYNRPWHTRQTIEALQNNQFAKDSEFFIYSDAPKNEAAKETVQEVRNYIYSIDGFKKITIIERETNQGLADNIIDGVTKIVNEYGRVIVLEDDLVTSPYFLRFMNDALDFYQEEEKVMHISGYTFPVPGEDLPETFFFRLPMSWGWATWANKWQYFERNIGELEQKMTRSKKYQFNLEGAYDYACGQLEDNKTGRIKTWLIFWYGAVFLNNGISLYPKDSMVQNIGCDGSGVHCIQSDYCSHEELADKPVEIFENRIQENIDFFQKVKTFYKNRKLNLMKRIINKILRIFHLSSKNLIRPRAKML